MLYVFTISPLVFWPKSKICTTIRPLGSKSHKTSWFRQKSTFFRCSLCASVLAYVEKTDEMKFNYNNDNHRSKKKIRLQFQCNIFFVPTSNYFVAGQNPRFTSKLISKKMKRKTIEWMTTRTLDGVVLIGRPNGEFVITLIFSGMPITT